VTTLLDDNDSLTQRTEIHCGATGDAPRPALPRALSGAAQHLEGSRGPLHTRTRTRYPGGQRQRRDPPPAPRPVETEDSRWDGLPLSSMSLIR